MSNPLEEHQFLGREFLAWLAFHADTNGGEFEGFAIQLGGRCVLHALSGLVTDVTLKGGSPGTSPELRYALAGGLLPKQLDLRLEVAAKKKKEDPRVFIFSLSAELLDLGRVKLPALLTEEEDDKVEERLQLLGQLDDAVQAAYAAFLAERAAPRWSRSTVPAYKAWLKEGVEPA